MSESSEVAKSCNNCGHAVVCEIKTHAKAVTTPEQTLGSHAGRLRRPENCLAMVSRDLFYDGLPEKCGHWVLESATCGEYLK